MAGLLPVLLLASAWAHRPHDVTTAFVREPEGDRAWAILDPHDVSQLLVSEDGGFHWSYRCGPPMADVLVDLAWQEDALVILARRGAIWRSFDGGESWESEPLAVAEEGSASRESYDLTGTALALSGGGAEGRGGEGRGGEGRGGEGWGMVATEGGLLAGSVRDDPGSLARFAPGVAVRSLALAPGDSQEGWAGLASGDVLHTEDGGASFTTLTALPQDRFAMSLAEVGGVLYAGTRGAGVFAWEPEGGAWEACTRLPTVRSGEYARVVPALAGDGDRLWATSAYEAVFLSEDGCRSWEARLSDEEPVYGTTGNASDPRESFVALSASGDRVWLAGFTGVTVSEDGGRSWWQARLIPADYARGVAFAPDYPADPRVFVGGYGGGAWWSADGGESWTGSAVGLWEGYAYDLQPARDLASGGALFFSGSLRPHRSLDGGETWELQDDVVPMERVRAWRTTSGRIWALGEDDAAAMEGRLAVSEDGGASWERAEAAEEALAGSVPSHVGEGSWGGDDALLLVGDSPVRVLLSVDGGDTWEEQWAGAAAAAPGAVLWPAGAAERLVLADPEAGVRYRLWEDDDWSAPETPPEGTPRQLVGADDGTLFLVTRRAQVYRSEDGGTRWEAAGDWIPAALHDLVTAPDFAETEHLLAGTQNGVYFSDDGGDAWWRLHRYERFEAEAHHLSCTPAAAGGCGGAQAECAVYSDPSHGLGGGLVLEKGDALRFTFDGTAFRVLAARNRRGVLAWTLEGPEAEGQAEGGELEPDNGWSVSGLEAGPKTVVLEAAGSGSIYVDAVEAEGEGEILPVGEAASATGADTGIGLPATGACGGSDTGRALLLPFTGLWAARRRWGRRWGLRWGLRWGRRGAPRRGAAPER